MLRSNLLPNSQTDLLTLESLIRVAHDLPNTLWCLRQGYDIVEGEDESEDEDLFGRRGDDLEVPLLPIIVTKEPKDPKAGT